MSNTPDSKSSRQAELDELRKQSLAQQNAQKLAETATTPVTLSDWQAQQKALKEQDRMSKTETAKMLHNYRGDTDEISNKLSTLREEDRKSKEEATRALHNYRSKEVAGTAKSPKRPDGKQVMAADGVVTAVDQRSGEESVAALAAGFNQNGTQDTDAMDPTAMQQEETATSSPESAVLVDTPDPFAAVIAPPAPALPQESSVPVNNTTTTLDGKQHKEEEWVSVETSTLPSPEKVEDILATAAASHDSGEETLSRAVTEVADNLDDDMDGVEETVMTEAQVHASLSGGGHVSLRLDVEFSFGLISEDVTPNTDKYMSAVASIAHSLFSENRPAGTGGHAIYNAAFQPFVRFVEDDFTHVGNGRGSKRQVVHASLPMFIIDWAEATSTRESVKTVLRNAIHDGSFLRLALESAAR